MHRNVALTEFVDNEDKVPKTISKKLIYDLLNLGKINDIESGIVRYFLKKKGVTQIKSKLILDLIDNQNSDRVEWFLYKSEINLELQDIEKIFELLIPLEDREVNGAVYTPKFIVDYIVDNTVENEGKICDCSCGSGAFLLGSLKRLLKISKKGIVEIIENNLYGADILDYSIRRAKIILSLFALINNEDKREIQFNLRVADSLYSDWKKLFPEIFSKYGGFDYVVGNPPYVRIQDLKEGLKEKLAKKWGTGNFNLYFAFFELGMNILNNKGKLGYITPNNYFTSLAGIELREYLHKNKKITRILNFNHLKLFDASTYTCITLMQKNYFKDYFEYYYIKSKEQLRNLYQIDFSRYYYNWLNDKKWRLMTEQEYYNVKKIETIGIPLGKLCPIRVGIATLKDIIYFVTNYDNKSCTAKFEGNEFLIEKAITRKIIKISSIKNEKEIESDKRRIIFPYLKKNGKYELMSESYLKNNFPDCYQHLLNAKTELKRRDKGKKSYPLWFAWGRTQGMDYKGKKLYTRTFYHKPDFMLDEQEDNLFCNGYAVFCKNHIRAIQKILNSKVMEFYVKKTSVEIEGNYQCYQKNFIEKFNIPNFTKDEWEFLEKETDEEKIDKWLINKYGLEL